MSNINTNSMSDCVARTRRFFEHEWYDINPSSVFLHVTTGAIACKGVILML